MSDLASTENIADLERIVFILGGSLIGLVLICIIGIIISLVCTFRIFKKLNDLSMSLRTIRLDSRKTLEVVENAAKRNTNILVDEIDGSERASPIFARRMWTPNPLPFDLSMLRESGEFVADGISGHNGQLPPSHSRQHNHHSPRRAQSFYGDY